MNSPSFERWTKDLNRQLIKEDTRMANKHMKMCSILLVLKKRNIKITMWFHLEPTHTGKMKSPQCWGDVGPLDFSSVTVCKLWSCQSSLLYLCFLFNY